MRLSITRGLAAWTIGLVLCPAAYVAIGVYADFAPAFALLTAPSVLLSMGYLLVRYLSRPATASTAAWHVAAEVLSWLLVMAFLVIVSGFALHTRFERVALTSTLHLAATLLLALPVVVARGDMLLVQRLSRLPARASQLILFLVSVLVLAGAAAYWLRPTAMPG